MKDFEHDGCISNFLASYKGGTGRLIGTFETAPFIIDSDGDMFLFDARDTAGVRFDTLYDKYSGDDWPEDTWSWRSSYLSREYMKCMPGVDYTGKGVITMTINGERADYYLLKDTIETTSFSAGRHKGASDDHWTGGQPFGTQGYLVAAEMGDGMHYLSTGDGYWYSGRTLISNVGNTGKYGCRLYYWPSSYVLSFANTVGSSVNGTDNEETSLSLEFGSLPSLNETVSKYVVGETTREANGRDYVFDGWYVDASAAANHLQPDRGDYRIDPATWTMPDANTALYAGWTPKTYEVTFDSVGGQMVELSVGLDMYVVLVDTDPSAEGGLPEVAGFCRD